MADKNEGKGGGKGKATSPKKKTPQQSPTTKGEPQPPKGREEEEKEVLVEPVTPSKEEQRPLEEKVLKGGSNDGDSTPTQAGDGGEEEGAAGGSWSGWFTSTINTAKEKSNEMLQYLKQDLSEFTETVSEAGRDLKDKLKIEENANKAVTVVGEKMGVVLEQMSTIFGVGPEDEDEPIVVGNSGRLVVDRVQAKIYSLALDEAVFLKDPEDADAYEKWLAHFDLKGKEDEISELLTANPHLQLHYSQFVPDKVTHLEFWSRFYYRVQLIFDEEAKQMAKEKEIQSKSPQKSSTKKSSSGNASPTGDIGSGSGDQSVVEISEEDQKRLLAEYEEELKRGDESGKHSRRSSGTQMSSSSSGSFAFVTRDPETDELKVE